jgi:hypothetical protein
MESEKEILENKINNYSPEREWLINIAKEICKSKEMTHQETSQTIEKIIEAEDRNTYPNEDPHRSIWEEAVRNMIKFREDVDIELNNKVSADELEKMFANGMRRAGDYNLDHALTSKAPIEIFKILLENGAIVCHHHLKNVLKYSTAPEILKLFFEYGVRASSSDIRKALEHGASLEVFKILFNEGGAEIDKRFDHTLFVALKNDNYPEVIEFLIEQGAKIEEFYLSFALEEEYFPEVLEILLEHGTFTGLYTIDRFHYIDTALSKIDKYRPKRYEIIGNCYDPKYLNDFEAILEKTPNSKRASISKKHLNASVEILEVLLTHGAKVSEEQLENVFMKEAIKRIASKKVYLSKLLHVGIYENIVYKYIFSKNKFQKNVAEAVENQVAEIERNLIPKPVSYIPNLFKEK